MSFFTHTSNYAQGNLALALAPALTPHGVITSPLFFNGTAIFPQVLARCLLVLADITATRYFNYVPDIQRDPILSAQGDRLRAECFSACNGVYARLDLLQSGFDGHINFGTTNVDIRMGLRAALLDIKASDTLKVQIGEDGLKTAQLREYSDNVVGIKNAVHEVPVIMPNRWIRALGNAAQIHRSMRCIFCLNAIQSQLFIAKLPPATGKSISGWLSSNTKTPTLIPRAAKGAIFISGIHRLSALKRMMTHINEMVFYAGDEPGHMMVDVTVPGARLTLSLTSEPWQGYSGEGALLESLAQPNLVKTAESIHLSLAFDSTIDTSSFEHSLNLDHQYMDEALAYLAVIGKLGFDAHENSYFHRELPSDESRILKDNPRLVAARKLVDHVQKISDREWIVHSNKNEYHLFAADNDPMPTQPEKCTCTWYLRHTNRRGPCKHLLAVQLKNQKELKTRKN